jgi:hypothetical protein
MEAWHTRHTGWGDASPLRLPSSVKPSINPGSTALSAMRKLQVEFGLAEREA